MGYYDLLLVLGYKLKVSSPELIKYRDYAGCGIDGARNHFAKIALMEEFKDLKDTVERLEDKLESVITTNDLFSE